MVRLGKIISLVIIESYYGNRKYKIENRENRDSDHFPNWHRKLWPNEPVYQSGVLPKGRKGPCFRKDSRTFGGSPFRVTRSRRGAGAPLLLFKTGVAKQSFAFRHSEDCPTTRRGDLYGRPLVGQLLK